MQNLIIFKEKKNQNNAVRTRVQADLEQQKELKRREQAKKAVNELLEQAEAQKKEIQRRRQENQQKVIDNDYKSIIRDARRVEYREQNKILEDREKFRLQQLNERNEIEHTDHVNKWIDRDLTWEREEGVWAEQKLERKKWREDRIKRENECIEQQKERAKRELEEEELKNKYAHEWAEIFDTKSQPQNLHLPQSVQNELLCNVVGSIDEYGSDDEYDVRAAPRRRVEKPIIPRTSDVDFKIKETRRLVSDNVLARSKMLRRTIK